MAEELGPDVLKDYLKEILETARRGDAREESYYPILKDLLGSYAKSSGHAKAQVTPQPKKTEAGNPDFRVWDGKQHIIGYMEAKAPTQENLEVIETTLGQERFFVAVKKIDEKVWEVIELTEVNKKKLISGQPCEHSRLHFDDMVCLNLRRY